MKKSISRIENYLNKVYDFKYNVVSNTIEFKLKPANKYKLVNDYDINTLIRELSAHNIFSTKLELLQLLYSNFAPKFNPFREYFSSLPDWNNEMEDYIGLLCSTVSVKEEDNEIWSIFLKKWLVGVVACAIKDDEINQEVLVFIGEQGIGKTTWMERLVPKPLANYYYSGNINPSDKDSKINLSESLFINLDELENLNKTELGNLKQFITQATIRIRRPYAAIHEAIPRRASLMGSVNNPTFLRDSTGNRRFLCVECTAIDHKHKIDIDMVYSQALKLYKEKFKYWFSDDDITVINNHNQKYKVLPVELDIVNEYFEPCKFAEKHDWLMTISEIHKFIIESGEYPGSLNKLGSVMMASEYSRTKKDGRWLYRLRKRVKE